MGELAKELAQRRSVSFERAKGVGDPLRAGRVLAFGVEQSVGIEQYLVTLPEAAAVFGEGGVGVEPQRRPRRFDGASLSVRPEPDQRRMPGRAHDQLAAIGIEKTVGGGDEESRRGDVPSQGSVERPKCFGGPAGTARRLVDHSQPVFEEHGEHGGADAVSGGVRDDNHYVTVPDSNHVVEVSAHTASRPIERLHCEVGKRGRGVGQERALDDLGPVEVTLSDVGLVLQEVHQRLELVAGMFELFASRFQIVGALAHQVLQVVPVALEPFRHAFEREAQVPHFVARHHGGAHVEIALFDCLRGPRQGEERSGESGGDAKSAVCRDDEHEERGEQRELAQSLHWRVGLRRVHLGHERPVPVSCGPVRRHDVPTPEGMRVEEAALTGERVRHRHVSSRLDLEDGRLGLERKDIADTLSESRREAYPRRLVAAADGLEQAEHGTDIQLHHDDPEFAPLIGACRSAQHRLVPGLRGLRQAERRPGAPFEVGEVARYVRSQGRVVGRGDDPAVESGDANVQEVPGALSRIEQNTASLREEEFRLHFAVEPRAQQLAQAGAARHQRNAFVLLRDVGEHHFAQPRSAEVELLPQLVAQHVPDEGIAREGQGNGDQREQQRDKCGQLASDRSEEGPGNGAAFRRARHRGGRWRFVLGARPVRNPSRSPPAMGPSERRLECYPRCGSCGHII